MDSIAPYAALLVASLLVYAVVPYWASKTISQSTPHLENLLKWLSWPLSFTILLGILHILAIWYAPSLHISSFHLIALGLSAYLFFKTFRAIFRIKYEAEAQENEKK